MHRSEKIICIFSVRHASVVLISTALSGVNGYLKGRLARECKMPLVILQLVFNMTGIHRTNGKKILLFLQHRLDMDFILFFDP